MKPKNLIPVLTSTILAIVLVVMACTQVAKPSPTTTPTPTQAAATPTLTPTPSNTPQTVKETYNALDPTGIFVPVQTQGLAPRLDTIDGKTIYVCQGEADPVIMPALYKALVAKYPKTTFIYYDRSDFGPTAPGTGAIATTSGQPGS